MLDYIRIISTKDFEIYYRNPGHISFWNVASQIWYAVLVMGWNSKQWFKTFQLVTVLCKLSVESLMLNFLQK